MLWHLHSAFVFDLQASSPRRQGTQRFPSFTAVSSGSGTMLSALRIFSESLGIQISQVPSPVVTKNGARVYRFAAAARARVSRLLCWHGGAIFPGCPSSCLQCYAVPFRSYTLPRSDALPCSLYASVHTRHSMRGTRFSFSRWATFARDDALSWFCASACAHTTGTVTVVPRLLPYRPRTSYYANATPGTCHVAYARTCSLLRNARRL